MGCDLKKVRDIFLDRDGTIIEDRHYASLPDDIVLLPGAGEALAALSQAGCRFFVVSNQSGLGRGYFSLADLEACHKRLQELLAVYGVFFTAIRYCPHDPSLEQCDCRKPRTGLWVKLQQEFGLNPHNCLMVGDKLADLRFGQRAGFAASVLVLTGQGERTAKKNNLRLPPEQDRLDFSLPPENLGQDGESQKYSPVPPPREETRLFATHNLGGFCRILLGRA